MATTLFHCLSFRDAEAGMSFLTALGFTEKAVYRNEEHPGLVDHAEFSWGEHGGVMCGSAHRPGRDEWAWDPRVGQGSCYLVVPTDDDVDAVYARALAASGTSAQAPYNPPHGGRACTVCDPENNQYSLGSYAGH